MRGLIFSTRKELSNNNSIAAVVIVVIVVLNKIRFRLVNYTFCISLIDP